MTTPAIDHAPKPIIMLVRPQLGDNIGAVARAMKNFGLTQLRLVAPRDGWPNPLAIQAACGAEDLLEQAVIYPSLPEAMADIHFALGTSNRQRDMQKEVYTLDQSFTPMQAALQERQKVALLFGPERTGLSNEDSVHCDALLTIPTDPDFPSLNLAQAVVVVAYAWFQRKQSAELPAPRAEEAPAPRVELQAFFDQLEEGLDAVNYFRVDHKKTAMWQNLRNSFLRAKLSSQEVRTLRGMLRSLTRKKDAI